MLLLLLLLLLYKICFNNSCFFGISFQFNIFCQILNENEKLKGILNSVLNGAQLWLTEKWKPLLLHRKRTQNSQLTLVDQVETSWAWLALGRETDKDLVGGG